MKNILTICTLFVSLGFNNLLGQEVTITIGYPDNENHFLYSIPTPNENAQFGGEYYFKVKIDTKVGGDKLKFFDATIRIQQI